MAQSKRGEKLDSTTEIQYSPSSFWISYFSLGSRRNYHTLQRTGSTIYRITIIPSRCTLLVARHLSSLCYHSSPNTGLSRHVEVAPLLSAADGKRPARSLAHCVGRTETPGTLEADQEVCWPGSGLAVGPLGTRLLPSVRCDKAREPDAYLLPRSSVLINYLTLSPEDLAYISLVISFVRYSLKHATHEGCNGYTRSFY